MSTFIEVLNHWGENFLSFAWPMLWQSSLLIAVVFAFDALFARRLRAAVRYALWLAVLVKLLLPPVLALPTSAVWWLWPAKPPLTPVMKSEVVSFDAPIASPLPDSVPQTVPFVPPPSPELSGAGWTMLAVGSMDAALLLWLAFRWWRVAAKVRRAAHLGNQGLVPRPEIARPHPQVNNTQDGARLAHLRPCPQERENNPPMVFDDERESRFNVSMRDAGIIEILQDVCQLARLRRCPRLKLVDDVQSPAVYGLFRPVILLPRALVEKLSARQLRAVLLHEAMHLRRGDVWVNCAQTLLQIAYWWHPLLWLANARLRRLREEAVDDAVMLALRHDADAYAPTLLEVAKFSFRRPLSGLALVGILESRSALRRRIERLVDFRPPRKAGLTFMSLCGIFAFSAVALPMGQGPAETGQMAQGANISGTTFGGGLAKNTDASTKPAPVLTGQGREAIYRKLKSIRVGAVSDEELPLSEVIRNLHEISKLRDPGKVGINFLFNPNGAGTFNAGGGHYATTPQINPATGLPVNAASFKSVNDTQIYINLRATNVSLANLLNAICRGSDHPIKYSLEDYGVVFSAQDTNSPQYEMREFKVDANRFVSSLYKANPLPVSNSLQDNSYLRENTDYPPYYANTPNASRDVSDLAKKFFSSLGVNLDPPKQVYFNERLGVLFVYATPSDLDIIERTIQVLNEAPPMVHIKTRFIDMPNNFFAAEQHHLIPTDATILTGVLTNPNFQVVLHELEQQKNVEELAEPEVTTIPGQRTQMRATVIKPMLADDVYGPLPPHHILDTTPKDFVVNDPAADPLALRSPPPTPVNPDDLVTKNFFIGNAAFDAAVREKTGESDPLEGFTELAAKAGVDLSPPKNVSRTDGMGVLHIHATTNDLKTIAGIIADLHCPPPMLHIKARFIKVPKELFASANSLPAGFTNGGVLPNPDFQVLLHELEQQKDVEELAEPEVTTITGRPTEMRATITQPIVITYTAVMHPTNINYVEVMPPTNLYAPQTFPIETGPILIVVPFGLSDGYTLSLGVTALDTQFFGYANASDLPPQSADAFWGGKVSLPIVLPALQGSLAHAQKTLYDGQTLVLFPTSAPNYMGDESDKKLHDRVADFICKSEKQDGNKVLLVLVTATLIDAAGNRLHSDEEMRFAQNLVPPPWPPAHTPYFPNGSTDYYDLDALP
jgi:beta-lactamase regulating signal transducer with metallopeptidase domain